MMVAVLLFELFSLHCRVLNALQAVLLELILHLKPLARRVRLYGLISCDFLMASLAYLVISSYRSVC